MSSFPYLAEMIEKANAVRKNAYAPISKFPVGACIRGEDHRFYSACNVENASFSLTICAESAAITNMVAHGCYRILDIVVIAQNVESCPPCGACRQRIVEFSQYNTKIHLCAKDGRLIQTMPINELMPFPFNGIHIKSLYE